jgi:hypothetical protein
MVPHLKKHRVSNKQDFKAYSFKQYIGVVVDEFGSGHGGW